MSVVEQLRTTELTPRTTLFGICVMLLLAAGVVAGVLKVMNGTLAADNSHPHPPGHTLSTPVKAMRAGWPGKPDYSVIIKRNLFKPVIDNTAGAPASGPGAPIIPGGNNTSNTTIMKEIRPFTPSPPRPPRPKLAYTGCVEFNGETYALLENLDLGAAQYIRQDSVAFGCKLVEIAPQSVKLEWRGETFTLNLGDNKTEVPTKTENQPPKQGGENATPAPPPANSPEGGSGGRTDRQPRSVPSGGGK